MFSPGDDPGPDFAELLRRVGPPTRRPTVPTATRSTITHGTTVRGRPLRRRRGHGRRPPGHLGQPDQPPHDGEGVPGRPLLAASPSPAPPVRPSRWCKLFQLQLEHYEKVEGSRPQPRGQGQPARRRWCAATCPPPCRASPSCRSSPATTCAAATGRLFQYDVTGGRYEERDYAATGSGSLHAGTVVKLGFRDDLTRDEIDRPRPQGAVPGGRRGLRHRRARPHPRHLPGRGHHHRRGLPTGRRRRARRAHRRPARRTALAAGRAAAMSMPFYVAPEQVMKDRADYARKGIARGRSLVAVIYADGILHRAPRTRRATLRKVSRDLRPHRLRRGRQVQRVRPAAHRRRPPRRPQGLLATAARTSTPAAWPTSTPRSSARSSPTR